jgi:halocyanin-like protein
VLRAVAVGGAAAAGLGGAAGTAGAQSDGIDLASWFAGVSNYEGVIDATGTDSVTVDVGVAANGGAFGFGPAAVRVDPGTTVTWRWTGRGGSHNVAADGFESELVGTTDHTFEQTFAEPGVHTYACTPHETIGMKGAVVVGDVEVNAERHGGNTESGGASPPDGSGAEAAGTGTPASGDAGDEGTLGTPDATVSAPFADAGARRLGGLALGGVFGLALASPGLFGAFLRLAGGSDGDPADDG